MFVKELTLLYVISVDQLNNKRTLSNVFYKLLPSSPLFSAEPIWLSRLATNLFAAQATPLPKPINPLQSPTHFFGFFKTILAIPKLSTMFFVSYKSKTIKLNCLPEESGVLCTYSAHLTPFSQGRKPQAYGIFIDDT
jgi:hypothetical protein